jgi:hypothetical protein
VQEISINYVNCSPSENSERFIRDLMEHLFEEAPSNSHLKLSITKVADDGFSGVLTINSALQTFSAISSARSPSLIAQQLVERIRRQLDSWKSNRFRSSVRRLRHAKPNRQRGIQASS